MNPYLQREKKGLLKKIIVVVVDLVNKARLEKAEAQRKNSGEDQLDPRQLLRRNLRKTLQNSAKIAPPKKPDQETEDDVDKSEPMPKKDVSDKKTEDDKAEVGSVPKYYTAEESTDANAVL